MPLIFKQLLPTTSVRNVWKHKRIICNLVPGPKGLMTGKWKVEFLAFGDMFGFDAFNVNGKR